MDKYNFEVIKCNYYKQIFKNKTTPEKLLEVMELKLNTIQKQ